MAASFGRKDCRRSQQLRVLLARQPAPGAVPSTWHQLLNQQLRAGRGSFGATKAELEAAQQGSRGAVGTDEWETVAVLLAELHQ